VRNTSFLYSLFNSNVCFHDFLAHKQTTTHSNGHDESGVCEGDWIKTPLLKKCHAVPSDYRDLKSDTSRPVASRTRPKARLDSDDDPAAGGYAGGNITSETDVPAVDETALDGRATLWTPTLLDSADRSHKRYENYNIYFEFSFLTF